MFWWVTRLESEVCSDGSLDWSQRYVLMGHYAGSQRYVLMGHYAGSQRYV